jgi:hypothetical protein
MKAGLTKPAFVYASGSDTNLPASKLEAYAELN